VQQHPARRRGEKNHGPHATAFAGGCIVLIFAMMDCSGASGVGAMQGVPRASQPSNTTPPAAIGRGALIT
jgi:hypothetical protein